MKITTIIDIYIYAGVRALAFSMIYIFMKAWQNGYKTLVLINHYGEARIEAIMIMLLLILMFIRPFSYGQEKGVRKWNIKN